MRGSRRSAVFAMFLKLSDAQSPMRCGEPTPSPTRQCRERHVCRRSVGIARLHRRPASARSGVHGPALLACMHRPRTRHYARSRDSTHERRSVTGRIMVVVIGKERRVEKGLRRDQQASSAADAQRE